MGKFAYSNQALAVLIVYLLIMIGIGWYASRRIKGSVDFVVAGRRLPLWLSVGTLVATWFCGGAVMGPSLLSTSLYPGGFCLRSHVPQGSLFDPREYVYVAFW